MQQYIFQKGALAIRHLFLWVKIIEFLKFY